MTMIFCYTFFALLSVVNKASNPADPFFYFLISASIMYRRAAVQYLKMAPAGSGSMDLNRHKTLGNLAAYATRCRLDESRHFYPLLRYK